MGLKRYKTPSKYNIMFGLMREPSDPEKLLTPSLVWVNASHRNYNDYDVRGGFVFFGIWHYGLGLGICWNRSLDRKKQLVLEAKKRGFDYNVKFRFSNNDYTYESISEDRNEGADLYMYDKKEDGTEYFGIACPHHTFTRCFHKIRNRNGEWADIIEK